MNTPLVPIQILSAYKSQSGQRIFLPQCMALCTPDTQQAIFSIAKDVEAKGGQLFLSDLFRSHDMQWQANLDYTLCVLGRRLDEKPNPRNHVRNAQD